MPLTLQLQACASLLTAALLAVYLYRAWSSKRCQTPTSRGLPPAAPGVPFIGDIISVVARGPKVTANDQFKKLGNIFRAWTLGEQVIHVGDLDSIKTLMKAEHELVELHWMYTVRTMFGRKSVINTTGGQHTKSRKILAPAFTPRACQQYIPRIVQIAEDLCNEWANDKHVQGEDCLKAYTFQLATELIVGFSQSFVTKDLLARHQKLYNTFLEGFFALPLNLPGFAFHKSLTARQAMLEEYEEHILALSNTACRPQDNELKTCMQMVVEAAKQDESGYMDLEFLKDTAFQLLFAGHDTSASALMMLLRFLKLKPASLLRLRDEQQQILKDYGSSIDAESVRMMPYADAAIKEMLHICGIAAVSPKIALKTFEVGGYTIPKGSKLQLEYWKVMEDDTRWADQTGDFAPAVFNPDRWLTEEGHRMGAHLPFGGGARMCLGYNFALIEIKILLAVLARSYEWEVDLTEPLKPFPLPVPARGFPMTFTRI